MTYGIHVKKEMAHFFFTKMTQWPGPSAYIKTLYTLSIKSTSSLGSDSTMRQLLCPTLPCILQVPSDSNKNRYLNTFQYLLDIIFACTKNWNPSTEPQKKFCYCLQFTLVVLINWSTMEFQRWMLHNPVITQHSTFHEHFHVSNFFTKTKDSKGSM